MRGFFNLPGQSVYASYPAAADIYLSACGGYNIDK